MFVRIEAFFTLIQTGQDLLIYFFAPLTCERYLAYNSHAQGGVINDGRVSNSIDLFVAILLMFYYYSGFYSSQIGELMLLNYDFLCMSFLASIFVYGRLISGSHITLPTKFVLQSVYSHVELSSCGCCNLKFFIIQQLMCQLLSEATLQRKCFKSLVRQQSEDIKKLFFARIPLNRFLAKALRVNKITMAKFLKHMSFKVDFKMQIPPLICKKIKSPIK